MQTNVDFKYDSQHEKDQRGTLSVRCSDDYGITIVMTGRGETGGLEPADARLAAMALMRAADLRDAYTSTLKYPKLVEVGRRAYQIASAGGADGLWQAEQAVKDAAKDVQTGQAAFAELMTALAAEKRKA